MPNKQYPQRSVVAEFKTTGRGDDRICECKECGREYSPLESQTFEEMREELRTEGCYADDCPSHWEAQDLPHPQHTEVKYKSGDPAYEKKFLFFWKIAGEIDLAGSPDKEARFDIFAPLWNAVHEAFISQTP